MTSLWLVVVLVHVSFTPSPAKDDVDTDHLPQISKQNRWNLVKDKFDHAKKNFIQPEAKKPQLHGVPVTRRTNSTRISKRPNSHPRPQLGPLSQKATVPQNNYPSALSVDSVCSPERYTVTLTHGNCTKRVETTMCYGVCKSYTLPSYSSFHSVVSTRHGLGNVCHCCAATLGETTAKRHNVTCNVEGRQTTKTFYVPVAGGCQCKQCVVN